MSAQTTAALGACHIFLRRGLVATSAHLHRSRMCVHPRSRVDAAHACALDCFHSCLSGSLLWVQVTLVALVSKCVYLCPHAVHACQAGRACFHVSMSPSLREPLS